jgi:hypothetical protein
MHLYDATIEQTMGDSGWDSIATLVDTLRLEPRTR